jgi:hypothetical protein
MPPYPSILVPGSRFFLSEYLTWRNEQKAPAACRAFGRFARAIGALPDA